MPPTRPPSVLSQDWWSFCGKIFGGGVNKHLFWDNSVSFTWMIFSISFSSSSSSKDLQAEASLWKGLCSLELLELSANDFLYRPYRWTVHTSWMPSWFDLDSWGGVFFPGFGSPAKIHKRNSRHPTSGVKGSWNAKDSVFKRKLESSTDLHTSCFQEWRTSTGTPYTKWRTKTLE